MADFFLMLSLLILVVIAVSALMRMLGQPLMVGYVISGMLVGPQLVGFAAGAEILNAFSDLGISFLLFLVGLSLSPSILREVGKAAFIIGAGQMIITGLFWYAISTLMGFGPTEAAYMAIALTFSSTIIVMKLLSDKDEVDRLHGSISLGILLLQDLAAIVVLVLITPLSGGAGSWGAIETLAKGIATVLIAVPISNFVLPKLGDFFARSQEFLFLFAIGWGMGMSSLFGALGFSIEAGALLAGVMLSVSPYSQEISSRLKPLRDFFIISFFLILGSRVSLSTIETMAVPAALFIVLILVAKPLVVMAQMWAMGYGARTGFLTGISMSQISEFSLILVAIGERAGQLPNGILALTTLVGLVTMAGSSYLIMHSERIYSAVSGFLGFAGRKSHALEKKSHSADCILMGYNRIGYSILKAMEETGKECLVIDFNPTTVKEIAKKGVQITYGDVWDTEFLRSLGLDKVKMVVSTVPDKGANMLIVSRARKANPKAVVIATARQISEAVELYGAGADYVILPHFLGGRYVSAMIEKDGFDRREYEHERKEHLKELKEREELGHEHPKRGS